MMKPVRNDTAVCFAEEWSRLPLRGRLLLTVYMVIGALGGLLGAHTVLVEFSHSWIAWFVSLIILEPVGLASGLANMFIITSIGGTLSFALFAGRRRWLIGGLLGLAAGLGAAGAHVLYTGIFHRETMYD